jgi:NADPH-dependent 2,4-dienoyl-CoA reductase/sulfur reductase-like enzyme
MLFLTRKRRCLDNKANVYKENPMHRVGLVIIGGDAAGMSAASAARRVNPELEVILLEKGEYISYAACSLPYFISGELRSVEDLLALKPHVAEKGREIKVFTGSEARAIDLERRRVIAIDRRTGQEVHYAFDGLVIATGASPIVPQLAGVDLKGIFTIRRIEDGIEVRRFIDQWGSKRRMKAVVVGGGHIGLEMCESLSKRGLKVTLIEKTDRLLGTMDVEIGDKVEEVLQRHGIEVLKEKTVSGFKGVSGRVSSGDVEADMVILGMGVKPNSDLAKDAGIELGVASAIKVNEHLGTSAEGVYAAGDCAEAIHVVTGKKVYIPLGTTANRQGGIAGENATGRKTVFKGVLGTAMTKVFELEVARTGLTGSEATREGFDFIKVEVRGSSRSKAYPQGKPIHVLYIVEPRTGRLLGAEMAGEEWVALRIDTLASCLFNGMDVFDIGAMDLGYAPPFATVWDPILIAANEAAKRISRA